MSRVCIVGAGAAGLCAARHLLVTPSVARVDILEQSGQLGGTWVYTENVGYDDFGLPIHTSMYKSLRTNLPKEIMGFPDFPVPDSEKSYLPAKDMLAFLQLYSDKNGVTEHIKFKQHVQMIKPKAGPSGELWDVTYKDLGTGVSVTNEYDYVFVCNGHYNTPFIPSIPGLKEFEGDVMHSHDYRVPEIFSGKRILVIGAGPSGMDIALELTSVTKRVVLSHHLKERPKSVFPDNLVMKPDVVKLEGKKATFADGSADEIDVVFLSTGYLYNFPFLHESCGIVVEDNCVEPLYKHLVNIQHPSMCFIGVPYYVCAFSMFDLQVRYYVRSMNGTFSLPSPAEMMQHWEEEKQERSDRGYTKRQAHMMGPDQMPFKIVQTKEDGALRLSIVPSKWENNGTLWWPSTPMGNLSTKEHSIPKSTWQKYSCVVKRVYANYEMATQELIKMEAETDTEGEEVEKSLTYYTQSELPAPSTQHSYTGNSSTPQHDFNNLLVLPPSNPSDNIGNSSNLVHQNNRNANKKPNSKVQYTDFNNVILLADKPLPTAPSESNGANMLGQNVSLSDVDFLINPQSDNMTILENQKNIIELLQSQKELATKILSQLAKHEVILEELYKKIHKMEHNQASSVTVNANNNSLFERFPPVKTIKELQELEEKLKDQSFRIKYIECMSVLCSEGTVLRGTNLCYKLVDFFFTRDVFLECSWTGNTRDDVRTEKRPFKFFENVRSTFLAVIRTADLNFSQLQCDDFFKRIIKNSKQRFEATIKPISTSSPKRLSKKRERTIYLPQEEIEAEPQEKREAKQPTDREVGKPQENRAAAGSLQEDMETAQLQVDTETREFQGYRETGQPEGNMEEK